ncbi:PadR family transcriptional regulator [Oceanobacillus bengalensis]|uniref:PadR family transcriptional regulator n=1 Tax=Oceanobacillus bengalensis TaxID=1435466 RepID=A0A494YSA9_9BACI|nr:PadR family transcriptional regulator [Oceanobacillus bengalensis]RKQ12825.1 PadR family transcriptional regulator [Oceanobacillus bengalensis]
MSQRSQLLKGILEGCILSIIKQGPTYGYELSMKLQEFGLSDVSEGSIYPILLRLQKEKLIIGEMKKSPTGPKRKYYQLSLAGDDALDEFTHHWNAIKAPVDRIIERSNDK